LAYFKIPFFFLLHFKSSEYPLIVWKNRDQFWDIPILFLDWKPNYAPVGFTVLTKNKRQKKRSSLIQEESKNYGRHKHLIENGKKVLRTFLLKTRKSKKTPERFSVIDELYSLPEVWTNIGRGRDFSWVCETRAIRSSRATIYEYFGSIVEKAARQWKHQSSRISCALWTSTHL